MRAMHPAEIKCCCQKSEFTTPKIRGGWIFEEAGGTYFTGPNFETAGHIARAFGKSDYICLLREITCYWDEMLE